MMFLMMVQMWKRGVEGPTRIQTTVEGEFVYVVVGGEVR
jgi:hypothetical protein